MKYYFVAQIKIHDQYLTNKKQDLREYPDLIFAYFRL
jgi:hypothetical protein